MRVVYYALDEPMIAVLAVSEYCSKEYAAMTQGVEVVGALGEGDVRRGVDRHFVGRFWLSGLLWRASSKDELLVD